jgi:hypothetical protein
MNDLSIGDGFKFGCGFFIAGFIAWIVITVIVTLIVVLSGATLSTLFGDLTDFGQLLPLLAVV